MLIAKGVTAWQRLLTHVTGTTTGRTTAPSTPPHAGAPAPAPAAAPVPEALAAQLIHALAGLAVALTGS